MTTSNEPPKCVVCGRPVDLSGCFIGTDQVWPDEQAPIDDWSFHIPCFKQLLVAKAVIQLQQYKHIVPALYEQIEKCNLGGAVIKAANLFGVPSLAEEADAQFA